MAINQCAGVQVHEWGGVFADIVTYSHYRQFAPGLRIAINPHGGHYWSTQARPLMLHNFPAVLLYTAHARMVSSTYSVGRAM